MRLVSIISWHHPCIHSAFLCCALSPRTLGSASLRLMCHCEESWRSELSREKEDSLSFALCFTHYHLAEATFLSQGPQVLSRHLGRGLVPLLHSRHLNIPVDSPAQSSENRSCTEPPVANVWNVSSISFWYPTWYIQALKTYYFQSQFSREEAKSQETKWSSPRSLNP